MKRMLFCLLGLLLLFGPVARDGSQARGAVPALTEELTLPGAERGEETTRAVPAVKAEDLSEKYLRSEGENAVLVIYCACTDGPELDRQAFEELFCADLDRADELRSVSAYYRYNSCGKVSLDFSFVYLDNGVSSAELYRQTEKDPWGLFQKLFRQAREAYEGDWRELDRDGDGYVDLVVMLSGEDIYKTRNDGQGYYAFGGGSMATLQETPDPERPVMCQIIHMSAKTLLNPLAPCRQASGPRVLIHEIDHRRAGDVRHAVLRLRRLEPLLPFPLRLGGALADPGGDGADHPGNQSRSASPDPRERRLERDAL